MARIGDASDIPPEAFDELIRGGFLELSAVGPDGDILYRVTPKVKEYLEKERVFNESFDELVDKGYLEPVGTGPNGVRYRLTAKGDVDGGEPARPAIQARVRLGVSAKDFPDDQLLFLLKNETGIAAFTLIKDGLSQTFQIGFTSVEKARAFAKRKWKKGGPLSRIVGILQIAMKDYTSRPNPIVALDIDPDALIRMLGIGLREGESATFRTIGGTGVRVL